MATLTLTSKVFYHNRLLNIARLLPKNTLQSFTSVNVDGSKRIGYFQYIDNFISNKRFYDHANIVND